MKRHRRTVLAMALGAIVASNSALAQSAPAHDEAEPAATTTRTAAQLDNVTVVGSRFASTNEAGMAPVAVLDQEAIEATGAIDGEDLLRSLPQVGDMKFDNTDVAANLNAARGDVGSINLRNIGTGNTLLLVNGRRMMPHPGTQTEDLVPRQTANMNAIPLYGVRQMQVLLGGASALYGSDAVAGVLNVVMDTTFQGLQMQAQYGGSENIDMRRGNFNVKAGQWYNDGRTRVTVLAGHTYRSEVPASEHPITANMDRRALMEGTPFEGNASFDNRFTTSAWGVFQTVGNVPVRRNGALVTSATGFFNIQPAGAWWPETVARHRTATASASSPARKTPPSTVRCASTRWNSATSSAASRAAMCSPRWNRTSTTTSWPSASSATTRRSSTGCASRPRRWARRR